MTMRIGLTGGIGSGKSTVAAMLVRSGATLVDTDAIARALTAPAGLAVPAIASAFGPAVVSADGSMDRAAMRRIAFADSTARQRLEAILHPMIGQEAHAQASEALDQGARVIVFDVPLLAESSAWRDRVDRVLVVDCEASTQLTRVSQRPGWSSEAARQVIAQQASRSARRAVADAVIHNDGIDLATLESHVAAVWARWASSV